MEGRNKRRKETGSKGGRKKRGREEEFLFKPQLSLFYHNFMFYYNSPLEVRKKFWNGRKTPLCK